MPSLLSPNTTSFSRSYTPLADEINPPFGNHAPTVTRNGTVVYGNVKRASSIGSDGQSSSTSGVPRSESDETLSPSLDAKGKSRILPGVPILDEADGDIGELKRSSTAAKGKGRAKTWDEEMGHEEVMQDSYPPVNSGEEDERRIQDNLAKFAAKDMARRRAARVSRQMPTSPTSTSNSSSSTSSFMRRPFSMLSTSSSNGGQRNSMMGMMGGWMGGAPPREELPVASPSRTHFNPYDPPAQPPAPRMVISPTSPPSPNKALSPFADPAERFSEDAFGRRGSLASSSHSPPIQTPVDNTGYGYVGAQWRGGAAAAGTGAEHGEPRPTRGEKWWHALCSWGQDLDGGYDDPNEGRNQAGRTNPNE